MSIIYISYTPKLDSQLSIDSLFVSADGSNYAMMLTLVMALWYQCHAVGNKSSVILIVYIGHTSKL